MTTCYLGLGSNLGNRLKQLQEATALLERDGDINVCARSKIYETLPYGDVPQDNFMNAVLRIETNLTPSALLNRINAVEAKLGRERLIHWGPRTMDIDILLMDEISIDTPALTIPHKEMCKRSFVLIPLKDVYQKKELLGKTIDEWIAPSGNKKEVWESEEQWEHVKR